MGKFILRKTKRQEERISTADAAGGPQHRPHPLLSLQGAVGNRAVGHLVGSQPAGMPTIVQQTVSRPGRAIDPVNRASLESTLQSDLSQVRVHTDRQAADSAQAIGAEAYTVGNDIVFNRHRYAPNTAAGKRLLVHETAHALHQTQAGSLQRGIAPPSSRAERQAEALASRPTGLGAGGFRSWGPAWQIHPQRLVRRGRTVHSEDRPGMAPGEHGPPIGQVEVRTGDVVEMGSGSSLQRISNLIALEFTGVNPAMTRDSRWLQFVWFEMTVQTPAGAAAVSGSIPTTSGTLPFTTNSASPNWAVDSGPSNPFYEAGGLNIRSSSATTVFDAPGGSSVTPLAAQIFRSVPAATSVTFTAHFDTYLVFRNRAFYHVPWAASTAFTNAGGTITAGAISYSIGAAGNASGLPTNLRTILHAQYAAFRGVT